MTKLDPVKRPNGKIYRPRKIRAIYCPDYDGLRDSVFVLGTHDVTSALELASAEARYRIGSTRFLLDAIGEVGWWRTTMDRGEPVVVWDEFRGAAGVRFECEER
ncbi:hypothetical protein [Amycolatopsis sp. CFH S0078]|uniref:hypothetical protein n=1 Tax=Amycolatopsis sp. CFH S0078 TaxID=1644108 RepID=UPI00106E3DA4|nr:hypothetical protein [Amycolatopsis sp. CFH S0078]